MILEQVFKNSMDNEFSVLTFDHNVSKYTYISVDAPVNGDVSQMDKEIMLSYKYTQHTFTKQRCIFVSIVKQYAYP